ncbi:MAG: damage-inducible protein CinA [Microbacterium sp.]|uniref:CinA family protein n=1 Tax=Microbacterium aquimaris TaxID=459816 RepID=UPI000C8CFE35|nr:CinA family protein [Microbacterium aquimaris]MAP63798.1 damage-inducible protein CinA [Microbacterium sp.]MDZ8276579.1 CinA family protein [Microbacterium aquimaris]
MSADEDPAERLAALCRRAGLHVAVAESLTSGGVASEVGRGTGAQDWFRGGIVAYETTVKQRLLGLPADADPCSAASATQLARACRTLFDADMAVSTTGVGGPDPQDGHPAGTVYIGWATAQQSGAELVQLDGDPSEVVRCATERAVLRLASLADALHG